MNGSAKQNSFSAILLGRLLLLATVAGVGAMVGCRGKSSENSNDRATVKSNRIIVVSYPLQFLTQRIIGKSTSDASSPVDSIIVECPATGDDPQNWQPTREAITRMQSADLIITNGTGATYAKWLVTVALPESKIRNTATRGMSLRDYIAVDDVSIVHAHGPEGEHSHPTMVSRTWLDPRIAKKQATYIADQLKASYPDLADHFDHNLESLAADLDSLTEQMNAITTDDSPTVLLSSPRLMFFSRAAGLADRHLVWMTPPTIDSANADLDRVLSDREPVVPSLILFDNENPSAELEQTLTARGLIAVPIDLIDRQPDTGDYLSAMRKNIERLSAALQSNRSHEPNDCSKRDRSVSRR